MGIENLIIVALKGLTVNDSCLLKTVQIKLFCFFAKDCWQQDSHKRPSFQGILEDLEEISDSSFAQDDQNSFRTLQDGWQTEIEQIFIELRQKEKVGYLRYASD